MEAQDDHDRIAGETEGSADVAATQRRKEAAQRLRQAKRRLMYARVGALSPSDHLNDSGAPPGSHDKKPSG